MKLNEMQRPEYPELKKSDMRRLVPLMSGVSFNLYTQEWFSTTLYQITLFDSTTKEPVGLIEGEIESVEWEKTRTGREYTVTDQLHVLKSVFLEDRLDRRSLFEDLCRNRRFMFLSGDRVDEFLSWDDWAALSDNTSGRTSVVMVRHNDGDRTLDVLGRLSDAKPDLSVRLVLTSAWSDINYEADHQDEQGKMITPSGQPVE